MHVRRLNTRLLIVAVLALGGPQALSGDAVPSSGLTFPPEWAPHAAIWMGWSEDSEHHPVQIAMIRALFPTVPIRLLVTSEQERAGAKAALAAAGVTPDRVEFFIHPVPNLFIRDAGPRFLTDGRTLAIADFAWNWYGYPEEMVRGWATRAEIDNDLARRMGIGVVTSRLVSEGGALDVSSSVMLAYRQTALQRNPGRTLEEIEAEYLRVYGKRKVVWLSRSPLSDRVTDRPKIANYVGWGANGHIDEFARFVNDSTILVAQIEQSERDDNPLTRADYEILKENRAELQAARNIDGRPFNVETMPVPALRYHVRTRRVTEANRTNPLGRIVLREFALGDEFHFVPALSYLNFVISNGVVLVPAYWREGLPANERRKDEEARATLQRLFPDRRVVPIQPITVNWWGGGMHCITQQEPLVQTQRTPNAEVSRP